MSFRRGAAAIGVGNGVSKLLGVLREVLFAYSLGTTAIADAFRLALSLVLIPTHFVTGELSLASVVPVLRRALISNPGVVGKLGRRFVLGMVAYGLVVAAVLMLGANLIVSVLAPGFDERSHALAGRFLKILGIACPLYTLASAFVVLSLARGRFRLTAVKPAIQNVGLLIGLLCFMRFGQTDLLAWGFVFGYLGLSALGLAEFAPGSWPAVRADVVSVTTEGQWREIWSQMRALVVLIVLTQCGLIAERMITTLASSGSVAAIDYARFVTETPTLLIAMPMAVAALAKFAGGEWSDHAEQGAQLCRTVLYGTLPFALGALTAAPLVVSIVFQRGAFGRASSGLVASALVGSSLGVVTGSLAYVVQRVFSSRRRNRELLFGLVASTCTSLALALLFVRSHGVLAIGLASSVGQGIYAAWGLQRLGILPSLQRSLAPAAWCVALAIVSWLALDLTGVLRLSRWLALGPGLVATVGLLGFKEVRRDVAWAFPSRGRNTTEPVQLPTRG